MDKNLSVHELSHDLRDVLSATVDAFVKFQRENGVEFSSLVILLALEMEASRVRRYCKAMGVTKEQIKEVQEAASACGRALYDEERAALSFGAGEETADKAIN